MYDTGTYVQAFSRLCLVNTVEEMNFGFYYLHTVCWVTGKQLT